MNKRDVRQAFDTCLGEMTFTPAHRRAVWARIEKQKQRKRLSWQGMALVGTMAATLIFTLALQIPKRDQSSNLAAQGVGATVETTHGGFESLNFITMEDAIAIARDTLEKEGLAHDGFMYQPEELPDGFVVSCSLDGEDHYRVTVDKATGEAQITFRKPVLAMDDLSEEEEAQIRLNEALLEYEQGLKELKGAETFWTLEERAKRSEMAKAAGIALSKWDVLPSGQDMLEQEAIQKAKNALQNDPAYAGINIAGMYAYASLTEEPSGKRTWTVVFLAQVNAESGISVSFPSRSSQ